MKKYLEYLLCSVSLLLFIDRIICIFESIRSSFIIIWPIFHVVIHISGHLRLFHLL